MKKLYTLAACLLIAASSYGQNNLELFHLSIPDTFKIQNPTVPTIIRYGFINKGTTPILSSDTLFLRQKNLNNFTYKLTLPAAGIPVNDTVYFSDTLNLTAGPANGTSLLWCDTMWAKHQGGAIIVETTLADNKDCKTVIVKNTIPNSISDLLSTGRVNTMENLVVYPNPANSNISFKYDLNGQEGTIFIHDVVGRLVYQEKLSKSNGQKEFSVNIRDLSPGMYMVEVTTTESRSVGRVLVSK
jgi:hypothetical protein